MSPDPYFTSFSFLECNSATIRNILMLLINLGLWNKSMWGVACKNDNLLLFVFCLCPLIHIFSSFLCPKHNSANVRNIFIVLGRIIEQVTAECRNQE